MISHITAPEYQADLSKLLEEWQPSSILAIGPGNDALFSAYLHAHPACTFEQLIGNGLIAKLEMKGIYDFIFISETVELLPKTAAEALLSSVRDLHAKRFAL